MGILENGLKMRSGQMTGFKIGDIVVFKWILSGAIWIGVNIGYGLVSRVVPGQFIWLFREDGFRTLIEARSLKMHYKDFKNFGDPAFEEAIKCNQNGLFPSGGVITMDEIIGAMNHERTLRQTETQ